MLRIAVLDDYQGIALKMADWGVLPPDKTITVFRDHVFDNNTLAERLKDFPVISTMRERTPFNRELMAHLPNLKLLVTTGMANAAIDLDAATENGIIVCGTGGAPRQPGARMNMSNVPELTWGLIISLARHIPQEDAAVRQGKWETAGMGISIGGKTLGILGLGNLGSQMAALAAAFGMPVIAWSQNLTAEKAAKVGALLVTKDELFAGSDFLTIHLKLSSRTHGLVGSREISSMKRAAYLINTSRGPIVDEEALLKALQNHTIAGAGLDVFDVEPLPPGHPFTKLDNVVLTPHLGYATEDFYRTGYQQSIEDISAYLAGHPVRVMNPAVLSKS